MYLYKSYCYETVGEVAASVHSSFFIDGFGIVQSVYSNGSVLTVNYLTPSNTLSSFNYSLASCQHLGHDQSFTGLTKEDSVDISSAMIGVLISAWAIKIIRRAL